MVGLKRLQSLVRSSLVRLNNVCRTKDAAQAVGILNIFVQKYDDN